MWCGIPTAGQGKTVGQKSNANNCMSTSGYAFRVSVFDMAADEAEAEVEVEVHSMMRASTVPMYLQRTDGRTERQADTQTDRKYFGICHFFSIGAASNR